MRITCSAQRVRPRGQHSPFMRCWLLIAFVIAVLRPAGAGEAWPEAMARARAVPGVDDRLRALAEAARHVPCGEITPGLQAASGFPQLRERMVYRDALYRRWAECDARAAFKSASALPDGRLKTDVLLVALAQWVKRDPAQAAGAAAELPPGRLRQEATAAVARWWAEQGNPVAAWEWARGLEGPSAQTAAVEAVFYVWAQQDPVTVLSKLPSLRSDEARLNLYSNAAYAWAARDPQAATAWLKELNGAARDAATVAMAEAWANRDPVAAARFAASLPESEVRMESLRLVALRWAQQDPASAANWAWSLEEEARRRALAEVMSLWGSVDLGEARRWIAAQPQGGDRDRALAALVAEATRWSPAEAAELTRKIENPRLRASVAADAVSRWLEVDEPAARAWMAKQRD